jgi:transglutaminase-like putative cysteine protease
MKHDQYLKETTLLDYTHPMIDKLVLVRQWAELTEHDRIGAVYDFVQNEIAFGYNESDDMPASKVLQDGYCQCNTKGTLLMALLRRVCIPCRFHGFTIDKQLQKGAITALAYKLAPQQIIHSWVEVSYQGEWVPLSRLHPRQKVFISTTRSLS